MRFSLHRFRLALVIVLASSLLSGCEETTEPAKSVRVELVSGGNQVGGAGTALDLPITVAVVDEGGRPAANIDVHWQVLQGGGAVSTSLVQTDSSGAASVRWTLGEDVGSHLLLVQAGSSSLTIRATAEFRIVQVVAGFRHSCALSSAGQLYCWGSNSNGQLGDGTAVSSARPVRVPSSVGFKYVDSGWFHSCGVSRLDQLFCWGDNTVGQLAISPARGYLAHPVAVPGVPTPVAIAGGYIHTCAVAESGDMRCWGADQHGLLAEAPNIASVASGEFHSCAVRRDRKVVCWGWNTLGELGIGAPLGAIVAAPTVVSDSLLFNAVTAGSRHSCALSSEGTAYCWGRSAWGETGQDRFDHVGDPRRVPGTHRFTRITTGNVHTCGIASALAYCWGLWLGDGTAGTSKTPVLVPGLTMVTDIAAGFEHTCAVARAEVWCWGSNRDGQLGQANLQQSLAPVRVNFN